MYTEPPPLGSAPFVVIPRVSRVILSAPHGAVTFRDNGKETWHPEDEFTAGMALLAGELCGASVISTTRLTVDSDPNQHDEKRSRYKQALRELAAQTGARWLIDLHGAGEDYPGMAASQLVDLGIGGAVRYLPEVAQREFIHVLEKHLGDGVTDRKGMVGFPARFRHRIAAFAHLELGLHAVQVEMKPILRIPIQRGGAIQTTRTRNSTFSPSPPRVSAMLQALTEFVNYLQGL